MSLIKLTAFVDFFDAVNSWFSDKNQFSFTMFFGGQVS